jgi:hypothetical protein
MQPGSLSGGCAPGRTTTSKGHACRPRRAGNLIARQIIGVHVVHRSPCLKATPQFCPSRLGHRNRSALRALGPAGSRLCRRIDPRDRWAGPDIRLRRHGGGLRLAGWGL